MHRGRIARSVRRRNRPGLALVVLGLLAGGCGGSEGYRTELQGLVDAEQWPEIRARVQLLRDDGKSGPWIDFAEGLALLHENADKAAEPLFERAVASDSTFAARIAQSLATLSKEDLTEGWKDRAVRRMAAAVRIHPSTDPGEQLDPVADYFFRYEKDYQRAYPLYLRLYRERPEPPKKHLEWVYRYGHCLEVLGFEDNARVVYEEFIGTWPDDMNIMRYVQWRYMSMLIDQAEALETQARPDAALEQIALALSTGWHVDLQQRARYLAAEIEERRGRLEEARDWYAAVVSGGGRSSQQLIDRARERLDALGAMGVH